MAALSDKLADLSVRVGDIEARTEAFCSESQAKRADKLDEMKSVAEGQESDLHVLAHSPKDKVTTAWAQSNRSMQLRAQTVRTLIGERKDAVDAERAVLRAKRSERNAALALDHALAAVAEAELAVAEALDARLRAADLVADEG
ncbi:hypothetical protein [Tropicimonas marinistellae]|uniref:hypothetical protein n=1 Tax=Tropicimonas marinistellae TaxID=1739787 RepID=UPI00082A95A6|nr:hypothetical protein [Tropicimonas marinistellae]